MIAFDIVERSLQRFRGNYSGSSQAMEAAAVRTCPTEMSKAPNLVGYVHDSDSKIGKLFHEMGWNIVQYKDCNHVAKSAFQRCFAKSNAVIFPGRSNKHVLVPPWRLLIQPRSSKAGLV
jgi:hypothetical protein